MAASLKLLPGSTVRWRGRRYLIVDYESLDAIIARQPGKRRLERIPVNEAAPDHASHIVSAWTPDLASVPEEAWQKAVKRFKIPIPRATIRSDVASSSHDRGTPTHRPAGTAEHLLSLLGSIAYLQRWPEIRSTRRVAQRQLLVQILRQRPRGECLQL